MSNTRSILIILIILLFSGIITAQDQNEYFNPTELKDYEPKWPILINPLLGNSQIIFPSDSLNEKNAEIEGFRLQVFATKSRSTADSLKTVIEGKIEEKVYVKFEVPNYKVRVGNCKSREEAEILKAKLTRYGYRFAWIVRTRIESIE